jgi:hypothetical protein
MWWWAVCCDVLWHSDRGYCPSCGRKGRAATIEDLMALLTAFGAHAPGVEAAFVSGRDIGDEAS